MTTRPHLLPLLAALLTLIASLTQAQQMPDDAAPAEGIEIATIERAEPIDFQKEVLPIFRQSCLACHNTKRSKSELVLETPQTIAKGSENGPVVVPGESDQSLLLLLAAHLDDPAMPPKNNKAKAPNLTPEQLGIIKLWIDQGAKGEVSGTGVPINWQAISEELSPIYAVAVSGDGQYVACSRANQIFIYHVPSQRLVSRLTDPQLIESGLYDRPGIAHRDLVHSLAFSPDGKLLASGGYRTFKLWRRPRNTERYELNMETESAEPENETDRPTPAVAASPDGRWLATVTANSNDILLWDLETQKVTKKLSGHTAFVTSLRFSNDSAHLLSGGMDKTVRAWKIEDGSLSATCETSAVVNAVTWIAGSELMASAGADSMIQVWKLSPQSDDPPIPVKQISGHQESVTCLDAISSDERQIVSGSTDGTARIWDIASGEQIRMYNHGSPITSVAARPDGKRIVTGGMNSKAYIWEVADGQRVTELKGDRYANEHVSDLETLVEFAASQAASWADTLTESEEKQKAASDVLIKATADKDAAVKKVDEKKVAHEKALAAKAITAKALAAANEQLEHSFASSALASVASDMRDKDEEAALALAECAKELGQAKSALDSIEVTYREAVIGLRDALTTTLDARSNVIRSRREHGQSRDELEAARKAAQGAMKPIHAVDYSSDGALIAIAGDSQAVSTFGAGDGHPYDTFQAHSSSVTSVTFTQKALISAATDQRLIAFDLEPTWELRQVIGTGDAKSPLVDRVLAIAFSPYGDYLATGGGRPARDGEIKLWRVFDGKFVRDFIDTHIDTVFGLEFSTDSRYLASASADKFVKVFHVSDGTLAKSFEGHTNHVLDVSWNRNNKILASSGADKEVKIWNFLTGQRERAISTFEKEVTSIHYIGYTDEMLVSAGDPQVCIIGENGYTVRTFKGPSNYLFCSDVTPDGQIMVAGGQDSIVYVWDAGGKAIATFAPPPPETPETAPAPGETAKTSPEKDQVQTTATTN